MARKTKANKPEIRVHVLEIHHEHGVNITVHRTSNGAELQLIAYVTENWSEMSDHPMAACTSADSQAVDLYFGAMSDIEWYEISETDLQA